MATTTDTREGPDDIPTLATGQAADGRIVFVGNGDDAWIATEDTTDLQEML